MTLSRWIGLVGAMLLLPSVGSSVRGHEIAGASVIHLEDGQTLAEFVGETPSEPVAACPPCATVSPPTHCLPAKPAPPPPPPFGGPLCERRKLTGDWCGDREFLRDNGITVDVFNTNYYQGVASGGREQAFQFGGRNDYFLTLNGEKLGIGKGRFISLHGETRYGEAVNPLTGGLYPATQTMAFPLSSGSVTALTGVRFDQYFSENMGVFAGKINLSDTFKQPLTGAGTTNGFYHSALMLNPIFARSLPYSTLGAGFATLQNAEPRFILAVFDTNNTPTSSGFESFFDNGVSIYSGLVQQTNFLDLPGHLGISGTYSNGKYTSLQPTVYYDPDLGFNIQTQRKTGTWCVTGNFDQALYVDPCNPARRWGVFGTLGIADRNPSPVRWTGTAGLAGASPIESRPLDQFGVGYFYLGVSETLKRIPQNRIPLRDEHGVELYYNIGVTRWCQITPDLQVLTPVRDRVDTSLIVGVRARLDF